MISKQTIKFLKSLQIKKYRKQHRCFTVEGVRAVNEMIDNNMVINTIYVVNDLSADYQKYAAKGVEMVEVSVKELAAISYASTNERVLAVVSIPDEEVINLQGQGISIVVESLNDPGNLGTIIRIADWYGIRQVICSRDTVDVYNPKVIAATKGSISRVKVLYTDLSSLLKDCKVPVLGAFLGGENIHRYNLKDEDALLLMGNESHGISNTLQKFVTERVTIPSFGGAESLNVAMATAVLCDNLIRSKTSK